MAPRRGRNTKIVNNPNYNNLSIDDVLCPICRSVLTQPVTLPCNHCFCFTCFEGTMQNANLACPLCRVRIGSWYRIAKKEKRLINAQLWDVVREKFSKQLENKSKGIDVVTPQELKIPLATPGEIRREYEIQKQKEDEEIRKEREAEEKASEALIAKITKEEKEYVETVKEEQMKKLKIDEQIAKKLSHEWSVTPSRTNNTLDQFIKKGAQKAQNFATKEYTCRVLCLDRETSLNQPSTSKGYSGLPVVQKKMQQLQKIATNVDSSDGSDCIESECRYFKPIDYRHNPPSEGKSPIKVPTRRASTSNAARIVSPTGSIDFQSNSLESAFARIAIISSSVTKTNKREIPYTCTVVAPQNKKIVPDSSPAKRKLVASLKTAPAKKRRESSGDARPKRQLGNNKISKDSVENTSPEICGFDNSAIKMKSKKNNLTNAFEHDDSKQLQEKADYELALKLQEEFNRSVRQYSTRSQRSQVHSSRRSHKQITLDEIVSNAFKVK